MHRSSTAVILLALLPVLVDSAEAQRNRRRWGDRSAAFKNYTFESDKEFQSKAMKRMWPYGIFLPKSYAKDKDKTYPWIIHLHGMNENRSRFSYRGGGDVLDELVGADKIPEIIVVTAEGGRTSFFMNGKYTLKYEDMVVKDLVQHVEKTYRVRKGRDNRALLGQSAGGGGALRIALNHPDVFSVVATHSAAILPKDPDDLVKKFRWLDSQNGQALVVTMFGEPVDEKMWRKSNPLWIAQNLKPERLDGLRIYFDCGTRDRYGFHGPNEEFHEQLKKRGIRHVWRSVDGGGHGNDYNADNLPHSLQFIAQTWSQKRGLKGLGGMLGGNGKGNGKGKGKGKGKGEDTEAPTSRSSKDIK